MYINPKVLTARCEILITLTGLSNKKTEFLGRLKRYELKNQKHIN